MHCLHCIQAAEFFVTFFILAIHTVHDVKQAQEQVRTLEKFLADRAEVYKKLKEWKDLWAEKVEFESRANDKSRYHDRGCELQTALKVFFFSVFEKW